MRIDPDMSATDAAGGLRLIDLLFVAGKAIVTAILAGECERLAAIPRRSLAGLRKFLIEMDLICG
jgi:hypothetical protein